jgi:hypothetical protein
VIFKHEPPNRSHHNKAMYCMMSDGHIYTLNHDIKRLEQKQDESDTYAPKVGETYYINEEAKPRQAKMIANIDEILQVIREMPKPETKKGEKEEKHILTLIHKKDTSQTYSFSLLPRATLLVLILSLVGSRLSSWSSTKYFASFKSSS